MTNRATIPFQIALAETSELARILRQMADHIETGRLIVKLCDINGVMGTRKLPGAVNITVEAVAPVT